MTIKPKRIWVDAPYHVNFAFVKTKSEKHLTVKQWKSKIEKQMKDMTIKIEVPEEVKRMPILVWRFEDAPDEYQKLSDNGGDEDWIAYIPTHCREQDPSWINSNQFGCCNFQECKVEGGKILIGSHA